MKVRCEHHTHLLEEGTDSGKFISLFKITVRHPQSTVGLMICQEDSQDSAYSHTLDYHFYSEGIQSKISKGKCTSVKYGGKKPSPSFQESYHSEITEFVFNSSINEL